MVNVLGWIDRGLLCFALLCLLHPYVCLFVLKAFHGYCMGLFLLPQDRDDPPMLMGSARELFSRDMYPCGIFMKRDVAG